MLFLDRRQIREALNQQTAIQFRQYAEEQLPEQPQKVSHILVYIYGYLTAVS